MYRFIDGCLRLVLLSGIAMFSAAIDAVTLESMLMPGPVSEVHAEYESDCKLCHFVSDKKKQGKLCIQCHDHENIADDLGNSEGFHGRIPVSIQMKCKHCHTEHEGRDAEIVLFERSTFDHSETDFPLKGKHASTPCDACHVAEKKYSQAPGDCYSCHNKSDIHQGKQGKKCGSCHSAVSWKESDFRHEETDFPLEGAHRKTDCASCHIDTLYTDTPDTCVACHRIQDVHQGSFGEKCESCHSPKKWDAIRFDHDRETDFALTGGHRQVRCDGCHDRNDMKKELPQKCYGCHRSDDRHKGRYGERCDDCHTTGSWRKHTYDHAAETRFPLLGRHGKTSCDLCHKGDLFEDGLSTQCYDCHSQDDVHGGKQGRSCGNCHNEKGWNSNVLFDHDLAGFPLIGMHAATQCEECHLTGEYTSTSSVCNDCHAGDDVHKTRLGTDCESCHNPNSWNNWLFDHDRDTRFKLDGEHAAAGCYDCHTTNSDGALTASSDCIGCHRDDDMHHGMFGRQCNRCHDTENFRNIRMNR